jgi:hypothetical protein
LGQWVEEYIDCFKVVASKLWKSQFWVFIMAVSILDYLYNNLLTTLLIFIIRSLTDSGRRVEPPMVISKMSKNSLQWMSFPHVTSCSYRLAAGRAMPLLVESVVRRCDVGLTWQGWAYCMIMMINDELSGDSSIMLPWRRSETKHYSRDENWVWDWKWTQNRLYLGSVRKMTRVAYKAARSGSTLSRAHDTWRILSRGLDKSKIHHDDSLEIDSGRRSMERCTPNIVGDRQSVVSRKKTRNNQRSAI